MWQRENEKFASPALCLCKKWAELEINANGLSDKKKDAQALFIFYTSCRKKTEKNLAWEETQPKGERELLHCVKKGLCAVWARK